MAEPLTDTQKGDAMRNWWMEMAKQDYERFVEKARAYGSHDLELMGATLMKMGALDGEEAALAFYAEGKIARIMSAIASGRNPSDDSWFDLTIYSMMARLRRFGRKT